MRCGTITQAAADTEGAVSDQEGNDSVLVGLEGKSNEELRALLDQLQEEEQGVSYRRRVLHGRIDILRAEMVRRLKDQYDAGEDMISGKDIERLVAILASDMRGGLGGDVIARLGDEEDEEDS